MITFDREKEFKTRLLRTSLPADWVEKEPYENGWCYLSLYYEGRRQKVAFILGAFPTWSSVKALGGFRDDVPFTVQRTPEGGVHISTQGAGVDGRYLPIGDRELVGAQLSYTTQMGWVHMVMIAMLTTHGAYKQGENLVYSILLGGLISIVAFLLTREEHVFEFKGMTIKERIECNENFPNHTPVEPVSKKDTVTINPKLKRRLLGVMLIMLAPTASARIGLSVNEATKIVAKGLARKEARTMKAEIKALHPLYNGCLNYDLPPLSLCCESEDVRLQILSLDVDEENLVKYISGVCPEFGRMNMIARKDLWFELQAWAISETRRKRNTEFKEDDDHKTDEAIPDNSRKIAIENARHVKAIIDNTVDTFVDGFEWSHQKVSNVVEMVADNVPDVIEAIKDTAIDYGDYAVDNVDHQKKKIRKATDYVIETGDELLGRTKRVGKAVDNSTSNLIHSVVDVLPDSDTLVDTTLDLVATGWDKTKDGAWNTTHWLYNRPEKIWKYFAGVKWKEKIDESMKTMPKVTESTGEAVGKVWYGFLKGLGIDMRDSVLNPTNRNIRNFREAIFGKETWFKFRKKRGTIEDVSNWIMTVVLGVVVYHYFSGG